MPRPALTEEQKQQTRRNIRSAAARLYATAGLEKISARAVADEAGVSVGTLYTHFDSLTALMQSLWKQPVRKLIAELENEISGIDEPLDRVRSILKSYAAFANDNRAVYRGAFMYVRPQSHDKPSAVALQDDRFFSMLTNAIEAAQERSQARNGDPAALAQLIWSAVHGAIALPLNVDRLALAPPEESTGPMIEALLEWLSDSGS
ncbi:MAG: TetR/AcrR family transcriptional regulator [Pseudomonadaceae bacterium]|nr:TetR/AcrR family transcriptional regulator [Pseudomonadaceae bacterium]